MSSAVDNGAPLLVRSTLTGVGRHTGAVPELPEVEALVSFLREHAVGRVVARVDVAGIQVLKTYDPPVTALAGLAIEGVTRAVANTGRTLRKLADVAGYNYSRGDPVALSVVTIAAPEAQP